MGQISCVGCFSVLGDGLHHMLAKAKTSNLSSDPRKRVPLPGVLEEG